MILVNKTLFFFFFTNLLYINLHVIYICIGHDRLQVFGLKIDSVGRKPFLPQHDLHSWITKFGEPEFWKGYAKRR